MAPGSECLLYKARILYFTGNSEIFNKVSAHFRPADAYTD